MSKARKSSTPSSKSKTEKSSPKKPAASAPRKTTPRTSEGTSPAKPAPKKKPAPRKIPAPKKKTPAAQKSAGEAAGESFPGTTSVAARIDVGFGNSLFIRGDGPGMSWERGVQMECIAPDLWEWSSVAAIRPFTCKVLLNDEVWADGEDIQVQPGAKLVFQPRF